MAHISGVLDLFFPLKNSGRALLSISWMLAGKKKKVLDLTALPLGCSTATYKPSPVTLRLPHILSQLLPVVVKPGAIAGDDDVVRLLSNIILAGVYQSVDFGFALILVVLQNKGGTE